MTTYTTWTTADLISARHELMRDRKGSSANWRIIIDLQITQITAELNKRYAVQS